MTRVAWLTDIHLNFLQSGDLSGFIDALWAMTVDAFMISGDIAEAIDLIHQLRQLDRLLERPIYFVLGNHDYYHGSIPRVRAEVTALCQESQHLVYLTASDVVELSPRVGLVGHDGWADGRLGDFERSIIMMADYELIAELVPGGRRERWKTLQALGDEAAAHARCVLPLALDKYEHAIFLTHVPPWREACWYDGKISDDHWAPHFTCQALGLALAEMMRDYPERKLTVLCGHTHGRGECRPLPNVTVYTGGAQYGQPSVERVFTF